MCKCCCNGEHATDMSCFFCRRPVTEVELLPCDSADFERTHRYEKTRRDLMAIALLKNHRSQNASGRLWLEGPHELSSRQRPPTAPDWSWKRKSGQPGQKPGNLKGSDMLLRPHVLYHAEHSIDLRLSPLSRDRSSVWFVRSRHASMKYTP